MIARIGKPRVDRLSETINIMKTFNFPKDDCRPGGRAMTAEECSRSDEAFYAIYDLVHDRLRGHLGGTSFEQAIIELRKTYA